MYIARILHPFYHCKQFRVPDELNFEPRLINDLSKKVNTMLDPFLEGEEGVSFLATR